jgi:hypothetical protein
LKFTKLDFYCLAETGVKVDFSKMDAESTTKVSAMISAKLSAMFGTEGFEEVPIGDNVQRFRVTGRTLDVN